MNIIATNRKAKRDYTIAEVYEAGIALKGNEVKSLRMKNCSIEDSFVRIESLQALLYNMHIAEFEKSSYFKTEPKRVRKLLLHKKEIKKLLGAVTQKGFTIIPLRVYFNDRNFAKVEIALAKGRQLYDKRKKIKEETVHREMQRELRRFQR